MMDIFPVSKLSLLILLLTKKNTEGCSCFPEHPQTKICSSDFGIDESIGTTLTTESKGNGALCGTRLPVGYTLILSGSFNGQAKEVRLCDLALNVEQLTRTQKDYFFSRRRSSYVKNCACKKIRQYDPNIPLSDGCEYPQEEQFCYFQTALCRQTRRGCRWRKNNC